ncbi:ferroxidase fet3 [Coemansia sp. RSA 989]|nr:ferroxidase fet3 [Coemansia sp. RSA 989]
MHISSVLYTCVSGILAARVVVDWNIGYISVNRDGYNLRRAIGVNGMLPIPPIEATIGDTLELNVYNGLDKSTSLHAHGLFQTNTTHMDGPAMINQCGIPPGESFTYTYYLEQTGTFWIHGHDKHEISDGLRGALVIHDREQPPFEYEDEYLLTFEDWFREEFAEREMITLDPNQPFPPPHGYAFGLINGVNGNITQTMQFEKGKSYRIRLVNMGDLNWFQFSLPGHSMEVIEIDGEYTKPHVVDGIDIAPAQRYSVLVHAHNTDEFNYRFNATIHAEFIPPKQGLTPRVYTGHIVYKHGAPFKDVGNPYASSGFKWLDDIGLHALDEQPALEPTRQIYLDLGNNLYNTGQRLDHINNSTFKAPKTPILYTALSMGELAMDPQVYGPQSNAIVLQQGEVVEVVLNSFNAMPHPIHIHSRNFQIIEYGPADSLFAPPPEFQNMTVRSYTSAPPRRDTITVPSFSYAKIRFTGKVAVSLMHCHLSIHMAMGMAAVFVESPDMLQETLDVPEKMFEMCRKQGIPTCGNAAGNQGLDFTGLPNPPSVVERPNAGFPQNH